MTETILCDSRQHKRTKQRLWESVEKDFNQRGYYTLTNKLPFGDYCTMSNPRIAVDTKIGFEELVQNFCSKDRKRVKAEVQGATRHGVNLIFLVIDDVATSVDDARLWVNLKGQVSGETLYKTLTTWSERYGCQFYFCKPEETATEILRLLGEEI